MTKDGKYLQKQIDEILTYYAKDEIKYSQQLYKQTDKTQIMIRK